METKHKIFLVIDGLVNLILGALLLLFPFGVIEFLGLPAAVNYFYSSLLGAVIFGIGIALFLELFGFRKHLRGLGIAGAIAINITGASVLIGWLLFTSLAMPLKGRITLWVIAALVLGIGLAEWLSKSWRQESPHSSDR